MNKLILALCLLALTTAAFAAEPELPKYQFYLPVRVGYTSLGPMASVGFAFQPPREKVVFSFDVLYLTRNDTDPGSTFVYRSNCVKKTFTCPACGGGDTWGFTFGMLIPLGRDQ